MSTAQDLPVPYGEPAAAPVLRLVPGAPLDFDEAVFHLRPRLHRYAVRRLGDSHEAEELVQEALLRAYTHREQLSTADDLAAWATVVTGRLVIDRLRVRGRFTPVAELPEGTRVGRDTADVVVARDEARLALDALDAMPPRQAALLWAREVEGQSYEDLCTLFGMTEPAVRSVLTRARKALRKEYATRGGTLPVGGLAVLAPWVVSLTWADKLRQAATRLTAPAAMGAAGVTILGGLVLSPFSALPHTNTPGTFAPAQAVVVKTASDVLHGFVVPADVAREAVTARGRAATTQPFMTSAQARIRTTAHTCVGDRDSEREGVYLGTKGLPLPKNPRAGAKECDQFEGTRASSITLTPTLPDNPTGVTQIGVTADQIDCSAVTSTPLYTCTPESSTQGALK